jgi:hypothetical protein
MKQRTRIQCIKDRTYPSYIRRDQIQKAWSTAKLRETVSVMDFGADPTGVADSYQAFVDALAASNSVFVPEGTFLVDQQIDVARCLGSMRANLPPHRRRRCAAAGSEVEADAH